MKLTPKQREDLIKEESAIKQIQPHRCEEVNTLIRGTMLKAQCPQCKTSWDALTTSKVRDFTLVIRRRNDNRD